MRIQEYRDRLANSAETPGPLGGWKVEKHIAWDVNCQAKSRGHSEPPRQFSRYVLNILWVAGTKHSSALEDLMGWEVQYLLTHKSHSTR